MRGRTANQGFRPCCCWPESRSHDEHHGRDDFCVVAAADGFSSGVGRFGDQGVVAGHGGRQTIARQFLVGELSAQGKGRAPPSRPGFVRLPAAVPLGKADSCFWSSFPNGSTRSVPETLLLRLFENHPRRAGKHEAALRPDFSSFDDEIAFPINGCSVDVRGHGWASPDVVIDVQ